MICFGFGYFGFHGRSSCLVLSCCHACGWTFAQHGWGGRRYLSQAVQELPRPDQQSVAIHCGAAIEPTAVVKVVDGQLLKLRPGGQHERATVARQVVQSSCASTGEAYTWPARSSRCWYTSSPVVALAQ